MTGSNDPPPGTRDPSTPLHTFRPWGSVHPGEGFKPESTIPAITSTPPTSTNLDPLPYTSVHCVETRKGVPDTTGHTRRGSKAGRPTESPEGCRDGSRTQMTPVNGICGFRGSDRGRGPLLITVDGGTGGVQAQTAMNFPFLDHRALSDDLPPLFHH